MGGQSWWECVFSFKFRSQLSKNKRCSWTKSRWHCGSRDLLIAWSSKFCSRRSGDIWRRPKMKTTETHNEKRDGCFVHNPGLRFTNDPEAIESQFERIDDVINGRQVSWYPVTDFWDSFGSRLSRRPAARLVLSPVPGLSRFFLESLQPGSQLAWRVAQRGWRILWATHCGRASLLVLSSYGLKNIFPNYYI